MNRKVRNTVHAAVIAALYAVLTHAQNLLLPGSATWAVQFRLSEALCVLAFFTPAAVPGLGVGCFVFNLTYAAAFPTDMVVGTLASLLSAQSMRCLRRWPTVGLAMPALWNALLVGWELTFYIGGGFGINALYVALGELAVLYTLGWLLYTVMKRQRLDARLFG